MPKQAISITLEADNVTWLKGRAGAAGLRSVSELLDQLVTAARESGGGGRTTSVVGTIDIDPGDPLLERADEAIGALFDASLEPAVDGQGSRASAQDSSAREKTPWLSQRPR